MKINTTRFGRADYMGNDWRAISEPGMKPEDLLDPKTWSLVADRLQPGDTVKVMAEDAGWWAFVVVADCRKDWAKVRLIHKEDFSEVKHEAQAALQRDEFFVKGAGAKKWAVRRKSDNAVMKDNFQSSEEAEAYADALKKQLAA